MSFPNHLAIIMDGNGRWAQSRGQARTFGHIKGARVAKKIITECTKLGIANLTLYAFSTENWNRPKEEVSFLMRLLERYIRKEREQLKKQNIRFKVIGRMDRMPQAIVKELVKTIDETAKNSGLNLTFALNYGGRQELVDTFKNIGQLIEKGELKSELISESLVSTFIEKNSVPDADLIIRTSGEMRVSNFLLWQCAYSEFYFTDVVWPDFTTEHLKQALSDYEGRERRFGKTGSQLSSLGSGGLTLVAPLT